MIRLLITGGAGFVGSNLIAHLSETTDYDITVLDNESLGQRAYIADYGVNFIKADILDERSLAAAMEGVDCIVHLAADTRVMDSIVDPAHNFKTNVVGGFQLLELARAAGVRRILNASTGGAILGEAAPPIDEEMAARPLSPYGASKLAIEGYCSAFGGSYGMAIASLRFSNVYGPRSYHKGSVVAQFFKNLLEGKDLVVYGDGSQARDYLFVGDLVEGIRRAIASNSSGVFQFGTGQPTTINDLIELIRKVVGDDYPVRVRYEEHRPGEVHSTWCDVTKARREFDLDPATPLTDGLCQTWDWFRDVYCGRAAAPQVLSGRQGKA